MCGLAGFFCPNRLLPRNASDLIQGMIDTLKHRGPDDGGIWMDDRSGVVLGHRRLSIFDLSIAGHQPMSSQSRRYTIAFNGEIYNFESVRSQIDEATKIDWVGSSDTEVLIEAIELWGLQETLKKVVGVFAIALWDNKKRCLHLARDRMGEKPLYYALTGNSIIFGSELNALAIHPEFNRKISLEALNLFLRFGFINAPYSIYENTFKVSPGTVITFTQDFKSNEMKFWSLDDVSPKEGMVKKNIDAAANSLEKHLYEAVSLQKVADVPVGAFLSGGVDSSTIVSLMQRASSIPIKTFTVGFDDKKFDEAESAKKIATHLGTDHTEIIATPNDALDIIPDLAKIYDEPFADPSQIPTILVSRVTKKFVTVALSGDGGDELMGGYNRYAWTHSIFNKTHFLPHFFRRALGISINAVPSEIWAAFHPILQRNLPSHIDKNHLAQKINKFASLIKYESDFDLYLNLQSNWLIPPIKSDYERAYEKYKNSWDMLPNLYSRMMTLDMKTYLPDDILVKVDRASMSVALETRLPFLDHRVVEFCQNLPLDLKLRDGKTKWLLRKVLAKYVPENLIDKPKMGFSVPLADWLRGPLKQWAEELLSEQKLEDSNLFDCDLIRRKWFNHKSGIEDNAFSLWNILMFQLWYYSNHVQWSKNKLI